MSNTDLTQIVCCHPMRGPSKNNLEELLWCFIFCLWESFWCLVVLVPSMILNWDDLRLHMYQLFMGASIDFFSGWRWIQISRPAFFFPGTHTKPVSKLGMQLIGIHWRTCVLCFRDLGCLQLACCSTAFQVASSRLHKSSMVLQLESYIFSPLLDPYGCLLNLL